MPESNRPDPESLQDSERYEGGQPPQAGRSNPPDDRDDTYDPPTVLVNRAREQGLGVGQKDIDYQRDATQARSAEQYSRSPDPGPSERSGVAGVRGAERGEQARSRTMANQQEQGGGRQPQQGGQGQQGRQHQQQQPNKGGKKDQRPDERMNQGGGQQHGR